MREQNVTSTKESRTNFYSQNSVLAVVAVILLCVLSFYVGTLYQKSHVRATAATRTGLAAGGFGRLGGGARAGGIGTVSSVSSTSITVSGLFNGTDKTYTITSSTTVTNNGQSAAVSDIKTGDRVLVRTSGSGSTTATQIDINPSFGGGQMPGAAAGSST